MKKRKIIFFIPSLCGGGAERVFLNLINNLDRKYFEPSLIVFKEEGPYFSLLRKDVNVINLDCRLRNSILKVVKIIKIIQPDVVISTLHFMNKVVCFSRIFMPFSSFRIIVREDNLPSWRKRDTSHLFNADIFYRVAYSLCDVIVCQSDDMLVDVRQSYKVSDKKLVKINNPIDLLTIENSSDSLPDLGGGRINLLAAGRLEKQKGFDLLIKAMGQIRSPEFHLHLLGAGSEQVALELLVKRFSLENQVTFHGFKNNLYDYMRKANVFILSSRYEGFPNVVLEAMACGCPVISFKCPGGIDEIVVEGVNGYTVPVGDSEALAQKIVSKEYMTLDQSAIRESVKRYALPLILDKYQRLFSV